MRRVCILTSVHPPFDTRIFHKQAKTLVKAGYDVTLIAQHDKNEVVDGVKIIALPKPRNRFWRMLGAWRVFKLAFKQKADVYHFHDPELLPMGLLLKLLTKGKVIYDVHEDYPKAILSKYWLSSIIRKPVSSIFNLVEKTISQRLDCVITATDDIAQRFKQDKTVAIKNYPLVATIEPKSKHDDSENPTVIYAGGLAEERGISEIVQAMEYLDSSKNIKLVLYGRFSPDSYEKEVKKLKGFEKVEYRGWIEPEELWLKMSATTAGVVCLRPVERYIVGMPVKLFEYMAAGLPVVASNFPLWKEIVEGNNCGLTVNPLDPREIADAVEYLLEHPEEAEAMGRNGRKAVMEKYNWENESKKLLDLYEELD